MRRFGSVPLCAVLLALTVAAFLPVWHNEFIDFDDDTYITGNSWVSNGFTESGFDWAIMGVEGNYWQPLPLLSLQFDAEYFSTEAPDGTRLVSARAVHVVNLCWHAASVLLLFGLLRRLTGAPWGSLLVAALFAVHPM